MKASLIIIGNEILSGRTQDKNLSYLANWLNEIGIQLSEVRVIRDEEEIIVETVNHLRSVYDYVFTTGGIGPTHDDITSLCIAKAFGVELEVNSGALSILKEYYKDGELTDARMKMTMMPKGSELIENPISRAPGFKMENVFILAGIPSIMQGMLEGARKYLKGGDIVKSKSIDVFTPESTVADVLTNLQKKYSDVEIGSYPFSRDNRFGTSLVMRSSNLAKLDACDTELKDLMKNYDTKY
jgi:molybdenum cofactor synthesis domain-containing protein|tara:strand:- start:332 stop:1054 length:723 start_codon:yes stop_codon:yes gene_type:complete